jgi:hypothetical protein
MAVSCGLELLKANASADDKRSSASALENVEWSFGAPGEETLSSTSLAVVQQESAALFAPVAAAAAAAAAGTVQRVGSGAMEAEWAAVEAPVSRPKKRATAPESR